MDYHVNPLGFVSYTKLKELCKEPIFALITFLLAGGLFVFIVYPVVCVLYKSLFAKGALSATYYIEFFSKRFHYRSLFNSLILAVITTTATTFLSFIFAYMVSRGPRLFRGFFRIMAIVPFVTPPFVFSLALIILGGRQGLISKSFEIEFSLFGWFGVILAQVLHFIPLCFIMIDNVVTSLDPNLDEAASNLGAGQIWTLGTVTIPLCLPGIMKAALMVFILSMADFGNPALIGGGISFLAVESYLLVIGQYNLEMASVYCVVLLVPSLIIYAIHRYAIKENTYVTVKGTTGVREEKEVHPVIQIPMLLLCFATSLAIMIIFGVVVGGAFTKIIGVNNALTLRHFNLSGNLFVLKNSIEVSLYAAIIGAIAGTILAYILVRKSVPGREIMEFTSISGFAVPGTVVGIGFILAFNSPPLQLTGTMAIIVLSMISRTIAVSVEAGIAKLYQIDKSIEEASQNMGAGSLYTFLMVMLPLMFTAFFGSLVYNFIHSMNTLSAVIFLTPPRLMLAPISIFSLAAEGRIGQACAISIFLILCVFASLGVLYLFSRMAFVKK